MSAKSPVHSPTNRYDRISWRVSAPVEPLLTDEAGRQAHPAGRVAALMAKAGDLFSKPPFIEKVDVLASKLPKA